MTPVFETHITIEPVLDASRLAQLKGIAEIWGFRVADLLMVKRPEDTPERSRFDTFMTGHALTYEAAYERMRSCLRALYHADFRIWRAKIEEIRFDTRTDRGAMINIYLEPQPLKEER